MEIVPIPAHLLIKYFALSGYYKCTAPLLVHKKSPGMMLMLGLFESQELNLPKATWHLLA